jgi:hypothetical protein
MKTLLTYEDVHDLNTVSGIINRYAPPSENNTESYIRDVCKKTGYPTNMILDLQDIDILIKFAQAIVTHENGAPPQGLPFHWYEESVYHEAATAALNL